MHVPLPPPGNSNNTADSRTLTHCVLNNNGASSYSIWAQAGRGRGLPQCPSKTPSERGRQRPFIHVLIRRWLCRGSVLCKQWLTILSTHSLEYCIRVAHFMWCVEALFLSLSPCPPPFFVLAGSRKVFCNRLCRWIGCGLRVSVQKIAGVAWACALFMQSDGQKMLCNGPFEKNKHKAVWAKSALLAHKEENLPSSFCWPFCYCFLVHFLWSECVNERRLDLLSAADTVAVNACPMSCLPACLQKKKINKRKCRQPPLVDQCRTVENLKLCWQCWVWI